MRGRSRYVFDANTLISAVLLPDSVPGRVLRWALRDGTLLASFETLDELNEVLSRPKFDRYITATERGEFFLALVDVVELVEPTESITVCRDPDDNKLLEVAVAGAADVIVTGDQDLLVLDPFGSIRIMTAAALLAARPN